MKLENGTTIKSPRLIAWFIWIALTQSVIIYFVVLQMSGIEASSAASADNAGLKKILLITGTSLLVLSFIIRFMVTPVNPALSIPSYIISLALAETSAIFGLVLGFQGVPLPELYLFFGMSLLGLLAQPPTVIPKS